MKQTLKKYYTIAVIFPSIIVIIAIIIFSIIDTIGYKSEWLTRESVVFAETIFCMVYCAIICILALTIFLNLIEKIRKNIFFSICSWFLLPISFISIVINHEIWFAIEHNAGKIKSDFIPVILLNVPFVFGLIYSYVKFLKKIKN